MSVFIKLKNRVIQLRSKNIVLTCVYVVLVYMMVFYIYYLINCIGIALLEKNIYNGFWFIFKMHIIIFMPICSHTFVNQFITIYILL